MGLGRPGEKALGRFLKGDRSDVAPATRRAFAEWARAHPAPDAQTRASGAAPSDYWLNITVHAAAPLCGVEPARLREWAELLGLGELNENVAAKHVKPALARVLEEMHVEDTDFIVQMVVLGADLSAAYDGFHSSNRNAQSGIGNFTSHDWGYVLLLTVLDKVRTEGVAGISQRLEKEGLKRGLLSLIVDYGLPIVDLCTDQCRGAPKDMQLVLRRWCRRCSLSCPRRCRRGRPHSSAARTPLRVIQSDRGVLWLRSCAASLQPCRCPPSRRP